MSDFPLPNTSHDLSAQVALVTGGGSGLGRRFARVLAACGAKVAVAGRRLDRLEAVADEIRAAGGECLPVRMDMTDSRQIVAAVDEAERGIGPINTLINNAGMPDAARAHKMSLELIDAVFDTNLRGPYVLSCEVARRLIAAKAPGRIVNISSVGAFTYGGHGAALYTLTKAGIARMTEVLAVEWSRFHINVNCIAPGAFTTEMLDGMVGRMGDFSVAFPRKRFCDPAQLDSSLLYLLSPASECVTGAVIIVDDGQGPR